MAEIPNDTRLIYDENSYNEKLKRSIGPGLYTINVPNNDCRDCSQDIPADPSLRYQSYGPSTCTMKGAVDDSSELLGLNHKLSKSNNKQYLPGSYTATGVCNISGTTDSRKCNNPQENTRLSNPPTTLRATGINRWEWLCFDPQSKAIEEFDRVPINYRMVAKDNHTPIIEKLDNQDKFLPSNKYDEIPESPLEKWKLGKSAMHPYAPGYPYGTLDNNLKC